MNEHPELIPEQVLMDWLGWRRRADLERNLRKIGCPFIYGRGGAICTTLKAVNQALNIEYIGNRVSNLGRFEFE